MHDLRWIREHPEEFDRGLRRRGLVPVSAQILDLDKRRRAVQTRLQEIQTRRNAASREIGAAKAKGGDAAALMEEVNRLKDEMPKAEEDERRLGAELDDLLATIPNIPAADVPDGPDESANEELRKVGEPRKFDFKPREHDEIGEKLGMMDFERAAKLSGARFVVLSGALARLERAIASFMLDLHTSEFGYLEMSPPLLVRTETVFGTGQFPKSAEDMFHTENDFWLVPTAEVPLTNLVAGEILDEDKLPLRFTAHTASFRSEAGAAGKDTRGMIRQHQFYKVELVSIAHPDASGSEHERMTGAAEEVLKRLALPYRVLVLCSGDMGFSAKKTYDIEVWLPGQGRYREISSCSNCGEFQARRMNARFRPKGEKGTRFVHTLNGSGLAVGRTLIAVLENYQEQDGSVTIPEALRRYMGGMERIAPP
jgi:seryl-tRNA synthetase